MVKVEDFKQYGLLSEDFKVDTYKHPIMDLDFKRGVQVGVPQLELSIKCHSEKSQVKNRDKCLEMLKLIIDNMINS